MATLLTLRQDRAEARGNAERSYGKKKLASPRAKRDNTPHLMPAKLLSEKWGKENTERRAGMKNPKNDLLGSVVCTVVFALLVACGNSNSISTQGLVRLVSDVTPRMVALPNNLNGNQPFMAALFQNASQPSQIQQSFHGGGSCTIAVQQYGDVVNPSGATTGFIPLMVPLEPIIHIDNGGPDTGHLPCQGVFSQLGGGTDLVTGGTLTNPGTPVYLDGTLSTLVVTGQTVNGTVIRCSDLTTTYPVTDGQLVQPYFVIDNNSVILGIGATQLPFTCNLNIPPGDQAGTLFVQWAKI